MIDKQCLSRVKVVSTPGRMPMAEETNEKVKTGSTFDSAYGFSFSIALGLILFIAGLVITLNLGEDTSIGLIFGIAWLVAGLILPLFTMRDVFKHNVVKGECPYCPAEINSS